MILEIKGKGVFENINYVIVFGFTGLVLNLLLSCLGINPFLCILNSFIFGNVILFETIFKSEQKSKRDLQ